MAFRGKVALVTGAASGMGRISARRLAQSGAQVAALDINREGLEETAAGLSNLHRLPCDVSDWEAVRETVERVERELGPIDRAVHAAAIMPTSPVLEASPDLFKRLMRINYEGTVHVALAALPRMVERGRGEFIFFGSVAGYVLAPHFAPYSATKAAVNAFVEILIHETKGRGVHILLACPPMTKTPLIDQALATSKPRSVQLGLEQGRVADPERVVDEIERALERGRHIVFPTREARILYALRRFAPGLLWRMILKAENG